MASKIDGSKYKRDMKKDPRYEGYDVHVYIRHLWKDM